MLEPSSEDAVKPLPCVGARLLKLRFCGSGKDSEVALEAEGHRKVVIPLDYAKMDLFLSGSMSISMKGWGDTAVILEIAPTAKQVVAIEEATISFPAEWEEAFFRAYESGAALLCAVALRLRLVAVV